MSIEIDRDRDKTKQFVQGRDPALDTLIEETEQMLEHTLAFLEKLADSAIESRTYIAKVHEDLARQAYRLQLKRDQYERAEAAMNEKGNKAAPLGPASFRS